MHTVVENMNSGARLGLNAGFDPRCYLIALCLNFLMCKIKMTTTMGLLRGLNKFIYKKQLNVFIRTANYVSASFITFVQIFKIYLVGFQAIIIKECHKNYFK